MTLFLFLIGPLSACIGLFVCLRLVRPLRLHAAWKIPLYLLIMLGAVKMVVMRLFRGSFAVNDLPDWVLLLSAWWNVAVILLFFLLLLFVPLQIIFRKLRPMQPLAAFCLTLAALALSAYGIHEGTRVPDVRLLDLSSPALPPALDGLRVLHLTDLHIGPVSQARRTKEVVARANALRPDLVLITGDIVDGEVGRLRDDTAPLAELRAPLGVWACPGNHEYYSGVTEWKEYLAELGIRLLVNAHAVLPARGGPVTLAAVDDPVAVRFGGTGPDIDKALAGSPPDAPRLLMAHRPAGSEEHARHGIFLQLSGHTHGGQALLVRSLVAALNDSYLAGLYAVRGMSLYVGNGAGLWSGYPVRFGVPPEITLFRLAREARADRLP